MYGCYEKCNILDSCVKSLRDGRRRSLKREREREFDAIYWDNSKILNEFIV